MKKRALFCATGLALIASQASAGVFSEGIDLSGAESDGELGDASNTVISVDVDAPDGFDVIGFGFVLSYEAFDPSWGSEARIDIESPDGTVFTFEGDGTAGWDDMPGIFVHGGDTDAFNGDTADGTWTFTFYEDFDDGTVPDGVYNQAFFVIKAIPAPGALALLGTAGLLGIRRRRS